jgi:hypothetical protein
MWHHAQTHRIHYFPAPKTLGMEISHTRCGASFANMTDKSPVPRERRRLIEGKIPQEPHLARLIVNTRRGERYEAD